MLVLFVISVFTMKIVSFYFFKVNNYYVGPTAFYITIKVEKIIFNFVSIQTVLYFTQTRLVLYYLFKLSTLKQICGLD